MHKSKKALDWQRKNAWFGENEFKTTHALIMHEMLIDLGVNPATKNYFNAIDNYMSLLKYYNLDKANNNG